MDSLALAAAFALQIVLFAPRWRVAAMLAALALLLAAPSLTTRGTAEPCCCPSMPTTAPLSLLLATVLDPATAGPAGRLRPRVAGCPVGVRLRLRRSGRQQCNALSHRLARTPAWLEPTQ
jgi:hypothetical protein